MPKITFTVDDIQLERLRDQITQKVFCSGIYTIADCRLLAEDIELKSGMRLGVNTLRRFWGLLEPVPPSKNTLDILALYCGYKNWSEFISVKILQSVEVVAGDLVMKSLINGNVNWNDYVLFRKKFRRDKNLGDAIFKLMLVALQLKDEAFLLKVFDDKISDYVLPVTDINPFFYSLALGSFVRNNPDLHKRILPVWAAQKEGQRLFFEFYVDIDHLCGYYGDYIGVYHTYKKTAEATMFVAALQGLKAWFLNDRKSLQHHNAILEKTKDLLILHPYPVFRKYASFIRANAMQANKNRQYIKHVIEQYIDKISTDRIDDVYMSGYVLLLALNETGLYKEVLEVYERLNNEAISDYFLMSFPMNQYKMNLAMAYLGLKEYKKAIRFFSSIKVEQVFFRSLQIGWDKIIYLLTKARFQKEGILTGNYKKTLLEVRHLIEKHRYFVYEKYCNNIDLWLRNEIL
jgi:hypothetical protein